ncbi:MAG: indole-3-glycerol phosphate synthase TrpC [Legionellales bacterium]|nr:indole-3-glycerol phosphate synthase TrpC [Legionellales bacterium]
MTSRLEPIIEHKKIEIAALYEQLKENPEHIIAKVLKGELVRPSQKSFKQALRNSELAVIAEIKRRSPSNGPLAPITDPVSLAKTYVSGKASAISILTEDKFFNGHIDDLIQVAQALHETSTPILRKDFIFDEIQIAESIVAGANAILCIVAVLGKQTKNLLDRARSLGIDVLVEVIEQEELEIAVEGGAEIIGINNRNLKTFEVDTQRSMQLITNIPDHIIKVAASGISNPTIAKEYYRAGFDAVLIGEALVKAPSPADFIRACRDE